MVRTRWFGLGGVPAGSTHTHFVTGVIPVSKIPSLFHCCLCIRLFFLTTSWLMVLFLVCVCRWNRCGCWIASATNPQMAHCISQLHISSLWRAALTTQRLQDRRSGWVTAFCQYYRCSSLFSFFTSQLDVDVTTVNALPVLSLFSTQVRSKVVRRHAC